MYQREEEGDDRTESEPGKMELDWIGMGVESVCKYAADCGRRLEEEKRGMRRVRVHMETGGDRGDIG